MRYLRKVRQVVSILCLVVYFLAYGIPHADQTKVASAAGNFTISGMVYNNGQPIWDGFGVKITGSRGTTLWATTSGGYYQFNGFSSGTYTLGHNQDCPSNTPANITISGSYSFNIYLECPQPKPKVTVWGRVLINGKPAHDGFGVRLKNKETGQEYWPKVFNGDGWYMKEQVEEGWYTFTHYHNCPGDNNIDAWIGVGAELAPQINLTCPKPTVTVYGQVLMDGQPAHDGFTVRFTNKESGQEYWPAVLGGTGWYSKEKVEEGWYTLTHWQECAGDNNFDAFIGVGSEQAPTINLTCAKLKVTLWGRVMINGKSAHDGFTVRLKNKDTGQEYWPAVFNGDGWYSKEQVEEGTYTFTHWQECPGDNNFDAFVGVGHEEAPQINLNCESLKVTLWGRVMIDGEPAHNGFTVRLTNKITGQEYWPAVFNGDGWYSKEQLPEGNYTFTHWQECVGDNNFEAFVGVGHEEAPQINLTCESPKQKHTLSGKVTIDGVPAYKGFGVLLEGYGWYIINNDEGRYTFNNIPEGRYVVRHNFNICPTNEGNPQVFQVDGRVGPNFSIVCPKVEPVPPIIEVPLQPTCSEILSELGITMASVAAVNQEERLYLPVVIGNFAVTPTVPRPIVGYQMDQETFIRLGTKMDDIEKYIKVVTTNDFDILVLDHEGARAAGFEPLLIDLANQLVGFQNEISTTKLIPDDKSLQEDYPLLNVYMIAASTFANAVQVSAVMNEVRGLSVTECVCGGFSNPKPEAAPHFYIKDIRRPNQEEAETYLKSLGFHDTTHIKLGSLHAGWTKRVTYQGSICKTGSFREEALIHDSAIQPGWKSFNLQIYEGYSPPGEPNPEVVDYPEMSPYTGWLAYVVWWHLNKNGGQTEDRNYP